MWLSLLQLKKEKAAKRREKSPVPSKKPWDEWININYMVNDLLLVDYMLITY